MKNSLSKVQNKIISKYLVTEENNVQAKSTDVNILLNRVKSNEKLELRKKIYSVLAGFIGIIIFG